MRRAGSFEHGRVVAHERKQGSKRGGDAHLGCGVFFARIVDGHLRRCAAAHHARPGRGDGRKVAVHDVVARLGDELLVRGHEHRVVAERDHAARNRRERRRHVPLELAEREAHVGDGFEGTGGYLQLRGRFDRDVHMRLRDAQDVVAVHADVGIAGAQRAQHVGDAVRLAVRERLVGVVHEEMLDFHAERGGLRLASVLEVFDERRDVRVARRLVGMGRARPVFLVHGRAFLSEICRNLQL